LKLVEAHSLRVHSPLQADAARNALLGATERALSRNLYSEGCVAIFLGSYLFAWRSSWRGWGFFSPGPVFRGRLRAVPHGGCELLGAFTSPLFNLLFGAILLILVSVWCVSVLGELARGFSLETLGAIVAASVAFLLFGLFAWCLLMLPWWFHRQDIPYVEACLRRALNLPAA